MSRATTPRMGSVSDAAKVLGVSRDRLWGAVRKGRLPATRDPSGSLVFDLARLPAQWAAAAQAAEEAKRAGLRRSHEARRAASKKREDDGESLPSDDGDWDSGDPEISVGRFGLRVEERW